MLILDFIQFLTCPDIFTYNSLDIIFSFRYFLDSVHTFIGVLVYKVLFNFSAGICYKELSICCKLLGFIWYTDRHVRLTTFPRLMNLLRVSKST